MGAPGAVLITSALLVGAFILLRFLRAKDPREPPELPSSIPFIGHLIGMAKHGHQYYAKVGGLNPPPIWTLDILVTKSYIVTSPKLMQSVQRNSKSISFEPLLNVTASSICGIRGKGLKLLFDKENGGEGVGGDIIHSMLPTLTGDGLDKMNQAMIKYLKVSIDGLEHKQQIDLLAWCRDSITVASTDAIYGAANPYRDPKMAQAFWDWEESIALLMPGILPSIIAKEPYEARERLVQGFINYYNNGGHKDSSAMTVARHQTMVEGGLNLEDMSRSEAAMAFGLLGNSVPSTFFLLFELCSRPTVADEIRQELLKNAVTVQKQDGKSTHVVDLALIREKCHHFVSAFQEMLRLRMLSPNTRQISREVLLDNKYLLKKGSLVQMPPAYYNRSEAFWGSTVLEFDSKRFLTKESGSGGRTRGFIAFGSTPHICPGRHFAAGEICALAAMLLLRFDIEPVGGKWYEPELNAMALTASVPPPKDPYMVKVTPRAEFTGVEWDFKVTAGKSKFGLIIG